MDKPDDEEGKKLLDTSGESSGKGSSVSVTWVTKLLGILALFTAALLGTISHVSVQALDNAIPDFQLNAMRSVVALVSCFFKISDSYTFLQ